MKLIHHYADGEGNSHRKEYTYFLQDLENTSDAIIKSPTEELMETGVGELKNIGRALNEISRELRETRERVAHTTGINLSQTTLNAIATYSDWKWSGQELGVHALVNLLDIDSEAAIKIYKELFGASNILLGKDKPLNEIDLPDELKSKIRQHFRLSKKQLSAYEDDAES